MQVLEPGLAKRQPSVSKSIQPLRESIEEWFGELTDLELLLYS